MEKWIKPQPFFLLFALTLVKTSICLLGARMLQSGSRHRNRNKDRRNETTDKIHQEHRPYSGDTPPLCSTTWDWSQPLDHFLRVSALSWTLSHFSWYHTGRTGDIWSKPVELPWSQTKAVLILCDHFQNDTDNYQHATDKTHFRNLFWRGSHLEPQSPDLVLIMSWSHLVLATLASRDKAGSAGQFNRGTWEAVKLCGCALCRPHLPPPRAHRSACHSLSDGRASSRKGWADWAWVVQGEHFIVSCMYINPEWAPTRTETV